ncbi:hypothetical protein [Paraburkholderia gardini]|uniref:hypothetical protein n=1 Tax=Paraburkholderia gardini TaxID=2823469 RepID=UPI001DD3EB16|nr:hypothetical protein [Paraburkholderia gardini]CAG4925264.1 hypothetical protein R69919_05289 [Paraburkholderia gardini]
MRFDRRRRIEGDSWTARKEASYLKRHVREARRIQRDIPLFADQFTPAPSLDVAEERARRERAAQHGDQEMRDLCAKHWRNARTAYFACPAGMRAEIADEWRRWRGPATGAYFAYVVEKHNGVGEARSMHHARREALIRTRIIEQLNAQQTLVLA